MLYTRVHSRAWGGRGGGGERSCSILLLVSSYYGEKQCLKGPIRSIFSSRLNQDNFLIIILSAQGVWFTIKYRVVAYSGLINLTERQFTH